MDGKGLKKLLKGTGIVYRKWVKAPKSIRAGELVEVVDPEGDLVGCGLWDPLGPVALRILFLSECPFKNVKDAIFYKVEKSLKIREKLGLRFSGSYRLLNSDGDLFSGLIVDVYNEDVAVLQSSSASIDAILDVITDALNKVIGVKNVYNKSVQRSRRDIGLEPKEGWIRGRKERVIINEEGVRFVVDIVRGQKTGFYLDQRANRLELRKYVGKGDNVLDLFSYTGAFGIHAVYNGAKAVTFVEEDPYAVEILKENLKINRVERFKIVNSSVWDFLRGEKDKFDIVVIDPPAFIQKGDEESISRGKSAYKKVYTSALKLAEKGSIAFLSSCSYFLSKSDFVTIASRAALTAGFSCYRFLGGTRGASPDHVLRGEEYLEYLKAGFLHLDEC